jgi:hypothetical protein
MSIPEFTADYSLYKSRVQYHTVAALAQTARAIPVELSLLVSTWGNRRVPCPSGTICCGGYDDSGRCNGDCCPRSVGRCCGLACCGSGFVCCSEDLSDCTDLIADPSNCGACGNTCVGGSCVNKTCVCPPGQTETNGVCCSAGQSGCGGRCCSAGDTCLANGSCCPAGHACGGECCATGQLCCIGTNAMPQCFDQGPPFVDIGPPLKVFTWCGRGRPNLADCSNCPPGQFCGPIHRVGGRETTEWYCQ